ncbi:MAG: type II CAAX endopeptidase family protein [Lachnospiraceae bacterium]
MKNLRLQLWEVVYPIIIYWIVFFLAGLIVQNLFQFGDKDYMIMQSMIELACIPVVAYFYKMTQKPPKRKAHNRIPEAAAVIAAVCFSVAINNFIALTPLKELSGEFQEINTLFYSGTLFVEILAAGILAPITEELLFRGVVQGRIRMVWGGRIGIIASSLIFGITHFNIVQCIYGTLLGIIFAIIVESTGKVRIAVFCHMAANVVAIITSETKIAQWVFSNIIPNIIITVGLTVIGSILLAICIKSTGKSETQE